MKAIKFACCYGLFATSILAEQTNRSVVPIELKNQPGDVSIGLFSVFSEYQQLYRSSTLGTAWDSPVLVTEVAFRVNEGSPSDFNSVIPHLEIQLSTSSRAPEEMSSFYSVNQGLDIKTVYEHDNVMVFAAGRSTLNPFEVRFRFDSPFYFDSSKGNLLIYMNIGAPISGERSLDVQTYSSLGISPFAAVGGQLTSPQSYGMITEFSWISVPEPGPAALVSFGLALMLSRKIYENSSSHCLGWPFGHPSTC